MYVWNNLCIHWPKGECMSCCFCKQEGSEEQECYAVRFETALSHSVLPSYMCNLKEILVASFQAVNSGYVIAVMKSC